MKPFNHIFNKFGFEIIKTKKHPSAISHLINFINHYNIDCVIDVGANNGGFGKSLRENNYIGLIHSFEPVSKTYEELKKLTSNDKRWQIHKLALGENVGEKEIIVTKSSDMASFLDSNKIGKKLYSSNLEVEYKEKVKVSTVDNFLEENKHLLENKNFLLKIDTQGYDLQVINGAKNFLQYVAGIITEVSLIQIYQGSPNYIKALQLFNNLGFSITGLYPISRKKDLSVIEMDCILLNTKFTNE